MEKIGLSISLTDQPILVPDGVQIDEVSGIKHRLQGHHVHGRSCLAWFLYRYNPTFTVQHPGYQAKELRDHLLQQGHD